MVRGKIEIKPIENKAKRHTALTKRRKSLEDKAADFFNLTQSEGAVIVFSDAGNCNVFAHPDVHAVLNRYDAESSSALAGEAGKGGDEGLVRDGSGVEEEEAAALTEAQKSIVEEEAAALTEAQKRIVEEEEAALTEAQKRIVEEEAAAALTEAQKSIVEEEEEAVLTQAQKRIGEAVENGRWNEAVEDLGVQELDEIYAEVLIIKRKLAARAMEIAAAHVKEIPAAEKDIPDGGSSVGNSSRGGSS